MEIVTNVGSFVAFPANPKAIYTEGADNYNGLTKREYFASGAMAGILAAGLPVTPEEAADKAVSYANALVDRLAEFED